MPGSKTKKVPIRCEVCKLAFVLARKNRKPPAWKSIGSETRPRFACPDCPAPNRVLQTGMGLTTTNVVKNNRPSLLARSMSSLPVQPAGDRLVFGPDFLVQDVTRELQARLAAQKIPESRERLQRGAFLVHIILKSSAHDATIMSSRFIKIKNK